MANVDKQAWRVVFADEDSAYEQFHIFAPLELLDGFSRKRDGASHVMLFEGLPQAQLAKFLRACEAHPLVVRVQEISEAEFWSSPSNSI